MAELVIRDLGKVRKALARAARTDASTAKHVVNRFIEIRPGIEDKLAAERHHLLTGRRGTGKSTLLYVLQKNLKSEGVAVATLDMEIYKGREYPDVLIEVLIELLNKVRPGRSLKRGIPRLKIWLRVRKLKSLLRKMLRDPQTLTRSMSRGTEQASGGGFDVALKAAYKGQGAGGSFLGKRGKNESMIATGEHEELKIQRLQILAGSISRLLSDMVAASDEGYAVVFLDDYYFVPLSEQPAVLDYLHQICKGTGVWLKVGGVGSRLNTYVDGNPPVGMEVGQDVSSVAIDVTLAEFATAQTFLERVLAGILAEFDVTPSDLFTGDARSRMVLACGGAVARDYITLTESALDEAVERMTKSGKYDADAVLKIWTVDVQSAVKVLTNLKEREAFKRDAGSDASALSGRWGDICDFSRKTEDLFILVPQVQLEREPWGQEIQQLENLRLIHRIGDTTPNAKAWQGVKVTVFMIDLGQLPTVRLAKKIPEFWSSAADFNSLRRASWVYTPDWRGVPVEPISPALS
ncbi:hypothetical protein E3N86_00780 [Cryobacterium sp. Hz7]|uniref:hypothetical protein n=1 Tax=Cryobacterium sp. Hz7 TaxID=1259166 RepID=UPI00106D838C|nr:hypothetical protein [Cryobacterium sp. Hz7]TFB66932.1 hypothetical protein E3N86_00780 [Cryobacterium sp. Hz7]